ncbi:MAG: hypothetical protein Alpg2KO_07500 [Alphaproteobacteria bacterium]
MVLDILVNMTPLYVLILVGYIAGRTLSIDTASLGTLSLFVLVPAVMFTSVWTLELQPAYLLLPALVLGVEITLSVILYHITRRIYGDGRANLVTMCAVMGNAGYFGIPMVLILFDATWVGVYVMMVLGASVFQATGGYYLAARGKFDVAESLKRLARFPSLYAVAAGLVLNVTDVPFPAGMADWPTHLKGAFIVVGMLIVGTALPHWREFRVSLRFLGIALLGKFLLWPALMLMIVLTDQQVLGLLPPEAHLLLMILALVPPGANIPAFALHLDLMPQKAATTVLIGTLLGLVYIPIALCVVQHVLGQAGG